MSTQLSETICVALAAVLLLTGCEQNSMSSDGTAALEPDPGRISAPAGFAAEAIEAAGGMDAWTGAKKLRFDCVVTFYEPDGSFYLTEQRYDVSPWSNSIEIAGREPKGEYVWRFVDGRPDVLRGEVGELPAGLERPCFAQMILAITTAPVRLLDTSARLSRREAPVRIQGRWYLPIDQTGERTGDAIFYQDRDSLLVDLIRAVCTDSGRSLAVRGYDYRKIEKEGPLVPIRIEIFSAGAEGDLQKRLVKIDCHPAEQPR